MGSSKTIVLKEHQFADLPGELDRPSYIEYLDEVWVNRLLFAAEGNLLNNEVSYSRKQPFFDFTHDNKIKAKNYVGFTSWNGYRIEIIPKVFNQKNEHDLWEHLIHWLSYCRKINFPFTDFKTSFKSIKDFPEALIYTFAITARDLIMTTPFQQYEEVVEVTPFMKGRLDVNRYINEQFAKGAPNKLVVEHEPLLYDNLLNQIIKFVSSKLQSICRYENTFHVLQNILSHLDEVTDVRVTSIDCDRVKLGRLFQVYRNVLDMCRFFILEGYLSNETGTHQNFSFLLPMEYVFEDYLAGFIENNLSYKFKSTYQARAWLTDQNVFQIQNDILLTERATGKKIIVDAKYKLRAQDDSGKKGISQNDLYQMISYAIRRNCDTVLLLYPQHNQGSKTLDRLTISSEMFNSGPIKIFAANIPFVYDNIELADSILLESINEIINELI